LFCLAYFPSYNSSQVYPCCHKWQNFSLFKDGKVFHCARVPRFLFLHPMMNTGWFHSLVIVNNAEMNMKVQLSLWHNDFNSLGYMSRSGISRSCGNATFNFLRNCHTDFHNGCVNLHSHQRHTKVPFPPHACQHLPLIFITTTLTGMRWHLIVFTGISLMVSDAEHFLVYHWPPFEKCLFNCFDHFWIICLLAAELFECLTYFGY
jgi:hypothetical protein